MRITVTARHSDIPDELRARAHDQMARVAKLAHRPQHAEVVFDHDHGKKIVEIQLAMPRGVVKIATAEADDFRSALDRAADKLRSQLDKLPERSRRPVA
ncbi:MAG TPA: ribosome-associated translation inhibitor RaiA [Gemmatimonadales bacterium]|jgi:ribosomal subunit interface protein